MIGYFGGYSYGELGYGDSRAVRGEVFVDIDISKARRVAFMGAARRSRSKVIAAEVVSRNLKGAEISFISTPRGKTSFIRAEKSDN